MKFLEDSGKVEKVHTSRSTPGVDRREWRETVRNSEGPGRVCDRLVMSGKKSGDEVAVVC